MDRLEIIAEYGVKGRSGRRAGGALPKSKFYVSTKVAQKKQANKLAKKMKREQSSASKTPFQKIMARKRAK